MAQISQEAYNKIIAEAAAKGISADKVANVAKSKGISIPVENSSYSSGANIVKGAAEKGLEPGYALKGNANTSSSGIQTTTNNTTVPQNIQDINQRTGGTQKVTSIPGSVTKDTTGLLPTSSKKYIAPNGKEYTLFSDGVQTWFDGGFGTKIFQNEARAIAEINAQNPVGSQYSIGIGSGEYSGKLNNVVDSLKVDMAKLKAENIAGQEEIKNKIIRIDPKQIETDTAGLIEAGFQAAKEALVSARQLEGEAQTIFGEGQIRAQASDMVKRGLDPAKAGQAALFLNLKGRANLMAKVKQIQSQFDIQISNLEMKKTELLIAAKEKGVENEKWVINQYQTLENNIQAIKNDYQKNVGDLVTKYSADPLLDAKSATIAQEAANVVADIKKRFDVSTPERKIAALWDIYKQDFAYVGNDIMNYVNLPFEQLVLKAAEMIRKNKK